MFRYSAHPRWFQGSQIVLRSTGAVVAALVVGLAAELRVWADEPSRASRASAAQQAQPQVRADSVSTEEFISGPFAEFFSAGDYPRALTALDTLAAQYPTDPLIKRYRAIVLDRLGRHDEALAIYDELLARDPNHVPTRFFRAQAYYQKGDRDKAMTEWKWVQEHSPSKEYRQWTEELLSRAGAKVAKPPVERKRFYLFGNVGWEYDSNVILKSNDPGTAFGGDRNASRFPFNLGLGYRTIQKADRRLDVIYTARESLNDDSLNEFNFTAQELALDGQQRVSLWDRDVTLGARYDFLSGFLNGDLFSLSNQLRLSADARLSPRTLTYVYNRFTASNFGPDGSNPPQTSRDGFYYDAGVTQYLYTEDQRSFVFIGQELEIDQTRGANFTRRGTMTRVGFRTPLPEAFVPRTDLDANTGFGLAKYPRFVSLASQDPNRRRNTDWTLYVALTHRIKPRLRARVFYRYVNADNRNDVFQYDRHVAGFQLLFTEYF